MNQDPAALKALYEPKQIGQITPDRQMCMIRISPCGKLLLAACTDGTVRRWDLAAEKPEELPPLKGHNGWVQAVAFAREGNRFYSVDSWGQLRAWSYGEGDPQTVWSHEQAHEGWIRSLAVSADGKRLATCGFDQTVRVWSAEDGAKQQELKGHKDDVFAVAFHPSGETLVSGDLKGGLKQWDLASGQASRELDAKVLHKVDRLQDVGGVRCLAFDPEGKLLAVSGLVPSSGGNVQGTPAILLFDWASGELKHTLKVGANGDGFVYEVHFHPASFLMAVASGNPGSGKLFFQRPEDEQPFVLNTKMANCHSLAVHPDGRRLIVSATNTGSNGNGRQLKNGKYPGNFSPLYLLEMPEPKA
jgi:WD40 repeat protein